MAVRCRVLDVGYPAPYLVSGPRFSALGLDEGPGRSHLPSPISPRPKAGYRAPRTEAENRVPGTWDPIPGTESYYPSLVTSSLRHSVLHPTPVGRSLERVRPWMRREPPSSTGRPLTRPDPGCILKAEGARSLPVLNRTIGRLQLVEKCLLIAPQWD